ncbi:MAG: glucose-1-phosphate adenylyltransferase subunit GlgD [Bacilli bacterium]|nr:glucose-1-phosphate adenylyltransferase subunit GlgD [Bacilli bacterium]
MSRILGILNLHNEKKLGEITSKRSLGALSFLGRYSFCDIPLSNFGNSKINSSCILVKNNFRSIIRHIDASQGYSENSKLGTLYMLYNEKYANEEIYNTDINNLIENKWILEENNFSHVVIAPTHLIYKLDFQEVIKQHEALNSTITVCYKKINNGKKDFLNCDSYLLDETNKLRGIYQNKGTEDAINISMETYVISISKLLEILEFSKKTSQIFTLRDILNYISTSLDIDTFEYKGYLRCIENINDYFKYSLELLDLNILKELTSSSWPIFTKTHDTPPAKYLEGAKVKDSFISNGAIISGEVDHSIICRSVKIGKNSKIKNSIILSDTQIDDNVTLENVIVDKSAKIIYTKELKGKFDKPIYIKQGDII